MTGKASNSLSRANGKYALGVGWVCPRLPSKKNSDGEPLSSPYALDVLARKNYKGHPLWLRVPLGDGIYPNYLNISCVFSANTISAGGHMMCHWVIPRSYDQRGMPYVCWIALTCCRRRRLDVHFKPFIHLVPAYPGYFFFSIFFFFVFFYIRLMTRRDGLIWYKCGILIPSATEDRWSGLVDEDYAFLLVRWLSISWQVGEEPSQYQLRQFQGTNPRDKTNPSHNIARLVAATINNCDDIGN